MHSVSSLLSARGGVDPLTNFSGGEGGLTGTQFFEGVAGKEEVTWDGFKDANLNIMGVQGKIRFLEEVYEKAIYRGELPKKGRI